MPLIFFFLRRCGVIRRYDCRIIPIHYRGGPIRRHAVCILAVDQDLIVGAAKLTSVARAQHVTLCRGGRLDGSGHFRVAVARLPVLEASHVEVFRDAEADACFDRHTGRVGVRGSGEGTGASGVIVAAFERIGAHSLDLGGRDGVRCGIPYAQIFRVVTPTANFRYVASAGCVTEFLRHRSGIRLQSVTTRTRKTILCCSYAEVAAVAELLTVGVCLFGIVLISSNKSARCGFIEAAKIYIGVHRLARRWRR